MCDANFLSKDKYAFLSYNIKEYFLFSPRKGKGCTG